MSKLNKQDLPVRRENLRKQAVKELAKNQQLNIRMDEDCIERLYAVAREKHSSVGAMVRAWIVERLEHEECGGNAEPLKQLNQSIETLLKRLDRLGKSIPATKQSERKVRPKKR